MLKTWIKVLLIFITVGILGVVVLPQQDKSFLKDVPVVGSALYNQKVNLGLDLQGGTHLDYKVDIASIPAADRDAVVKGVITVLTNRVNGLGVAEPVIYESTVGSEPHIIVELAGIKDIDEAKKIVGKTIQLDFKEQNTTVDPQIKTKTEQQAQDFLTATQKDPANFDTIFAPYEKKPAIALTTDTDWKWLKDLPDTEQKAITATQVGGVVATLQEPAAGAYQVDSSGQMVQQQGKIAIKVLAREDNAERSTDVTETRKAAHILIAYKGATRAADTITRTDAEALTIANDVLKQAQEGKDFGSLVKQYSDEPGAAARSGDLGYFGRGQMAQAFEQAVFDASAPGLIQRVVRTEFGYHIITVADIKPATTTKTQETRIKLESAVFSTVPDGWASTGLTGQYTVGASLGASALHDSLIAGFYGLIAIALFMILYYRLPGLLASLALIIYGILLVAVIQYFGLVMTLAGIAGAILSMGIAVDANVLIFERMKEELRIGKALNIAIEDGFKRAWTSIRDSNVTTLLICLILFLFGSSIVKGFAITLTIGIIISLITAVWVTRTFLRATARTALRKALFLFGK